MKKIITVALILVAQPAEACHRFSKWYYPYPQKCKVLTKQINEISYIPDIMPPIRSDDPLPEQKHIEIPEFILPHMEDWDDVQHKAATIKLRLIQENKWKDK